MTEDTQELVEMKRRITTQQEIAFVMVLMLFAAFLLRSRRQSDTDADLVAVAEAAAVVLDELIEIGQELQGAKGSSV